MRIVFLGTPSFAVPSLDALVKAGHQVAAVYTQPDRPKGRGNQLAQSAVKTAALDYGLTVLQPERIRRAESFESLRALEPELMIVVGYGQIIPQTIIDLPRHGILNVHGSLLPKYRGAAPIQWAIANDEETTGVTIMQIDAGLDTGDMLLKSETQIGADETAPELGARLALLGAASLLQAIEDLQAGRLHSEKQDNEEATHAPILKKTDGEVDWQRSANEIYNRFRGFTPWPGAYTVFREMPLGLSAMRPIDSNALPPGVLAIDRKRLLVGCGGNSTLELLEVQPAGKTRMSAESLVNGYKLKEGERLGPNK